MALGLKETEALWRQNSRELRIAQAAVAGAAADVRVAGQTPNPDVSLNVLSISPWSGYGAGSLKDKKMDSQFRIDQVIERGGKRDLRVKSAESRFEAARFDMDDMARQQIAVLRYAHYNPRLAEEKQARSLDTVGL